VALLLHPALLELPADVLGLTQWLLAEKEEWQNQVTNTNRYGYQMANCQRRKEALFNYPSS
jgi:hypothetical protein